MMTGFRSRRSARVVVTFLSMALLGCVSMGLTAGSASASLLPSCAVTPTVTPFTPWGDTNSYFLMPGGGFETGGAGWALSGGAGVVDGNEPFFVNSSTDTHSLAMPTGSAATSATVCVAMGENTVRLFVRNSGVESSVLHIQASVQNPLTGLVLSTGYDIRGDASSPGWKATSPLLIPNLLGGIAGTQNLTLVFTTTGTPATWNIDDVYVDPFKQR